MKNIAILGATEKEGRYAKKAQTILMEKGYNVLPVSVRFDKVLGVKTYKSLAEIAEPIDTLTIYVNLRILAQQINDIADMQIRRVIFNPGTESPELEETLKASGKEIVHGCTIVMLNTGQF